MKVEIWFDKSSTAIIYENAYAEYQKGNFVCIGYVDAKLGKTVDKYPMASIFKVRETNFQSSQPNSKEKK